MDTTPPTCEPPPPTAAVCGAVLTGGSSRRMGRDKALLTLPDGRPMAAWVVERLARVCDPVLAIDPAPERLAPLRAMPIADEIPGRGPLGGLVAALAHSSSRPVFLIGCDMPLVEPALVTGLAERLGDHDAVVPVLGERWQPLGALYSASLLERARRLLETGPRGLHELLAAARVRWVHERELRELDPALASFTNVNAPGDLDALVARLAP